MTDLQTLYRFVLHLVSCLLVVGLVFMISPVLASPCEAGKEEIVKAEDIINELRVGGTDVIDYSNCIVEGDLNLFRLPEKAETGKYLFRLNSSHKKYLKNGSVSNTTRQAFGNNTVSLSSKANITKEDAKNWTIEDGNRIYTIKDIDTDLNIYTGVIKITRPLKFSKAVFKGNIGTWNQSMGLVAQPPVKFLSTVNFVEACFEDHVNFDGAIFVEDAKFGGAHFHKMASFTEATFNKFAGFRSVQFDERALFRETVFEGRTDFAVATFNWIALFDKSKFRYKGEHGANFLFTKFNGLYTVFSEAQFNSPACFTSTNFHGPTFFSRSTFENQAWFICGCRFDDDVSFKGAKFLKKGSIPREKQGKAPYAPVLFSGVVFSGNAIFSDVQFNQVSFCEVGTGCDLGMDTIFRKKADFRRATFTTLDLQRVIFESNVDFSNADFGEKVDFSNVEFQSNVDFSGANFSKKVNFTDMDIERASITLRWDQLCEKEGKGWLCRIKGLIWDDLT